MAPTPSVCSRIPSAELISLPTDWRLVRVNANKRPIVGNKWFDADNYSPDDAAALNGSGPPAWGLKCGPITGVMVLDLDATGWRESFLHITGHSVDELPPTIAWTSGKPGRSGHAFQVDPDWWPFLANRRSWCNSNGETCWELRWDRCQSVIIGRHPETGSYRWLDGRSPQQIPDAAMAPDWLLEALLVQELSDAKPVQPTADDAARAVAMLQALPPAEFSSYEAWLRIGMALHHTNTGLLSAWVDWCRSMSNFDEAECLDKWQSFGNSHKGRPVTIGTLHFLAKRYGYWEPSREPNRNAIGFAHHVEADRQQTKPLTFEQRWAVLEDHADAVSRQPWPLMKAVASLANCASELDLHRLTARNMEQLLEAAHRRQRPTAAPLMPGASFAVRSTPWAVDGVFRHGLNLLVGQPGAGKSRLAAACLAAWLRGDRMWLGRKMPCDLPPEQRHALIIGSDQSLEDWAITLEPVGLVQRFGSGEVRLHPRLTLHSLETGTLLDSDGQAFIRRWADDHPHGAVLVDSLASCLPPGIDEDKAAVARPVHGLAEAIGTCWAVLTHHSRKAAGKDQNLGVGAGRGSSAIDGAVSRVVGLGLIYKMENGVLTPQESDPRRELLSTKRGGATLHLIVRSDASGFWSNEGSADDLKRQERRERTLAGLTDAQAGVLDVLEDASGWLTGRQVVEGLLEPGEEYDNRGKQAACTRKILKRLVVVGLIETQKVGRDRMFRLASAGQESQESNLARDESRESGSNCSNAAPQGILPALMPTLTGSDRLYSPPEQAGEQVELPRAVGEQSGEQVKPTAPQQESQESHLPFSADGSHAPSGTSTDWVEAACAALKLAPHPMHIPEVMGWLRARDAGLTQRQAGDALERLRAADYDDDQPVLDLA